MAAAAVLYSDKFVDITAQDITIKWYYMALLLPWSKTVRFSELQRVDGEPEKSVGPTAKLWGMNTAAPVWWACGEASWAARDSASTITLKVCGETIQKGFSVENRAAALEVIHAHWQPTDRTV